MVDKKNLTSMFQTRAHDIGVDLGTQNTIICFKESGIALKDASCLAVDDKNQEVIAVGKEAKDMMGRTPEGMTVISPLKNGVISDMDAAAAMLRHYFKKTLNGKIGNKPRVVASVPSGITEVERIAVEDVIKRTGAGSVELIEAPLAAAVGASLQPSSSRGFIILDIGSGKTEAAVIALGDIIVSTTSRIGSSDIDEGIIRFIRKKYGLRIGQSEAEEIKIKIGAAFPTEETFNTFYDVKGRSAVDNLPKSVTVHAEEIREAIMPVVRQLTDVLINVMEDVPAQLASDILETGVTLTGGGTLLRGFDKFIAQESEIPVHTVERPDDCIAEGLRKSLDIVYSPRDSRKKRKMLR
jgi:rod shape-determining protein MreB